MSTPTKLKQHYPLLDAAQYLAALLVILVHCGRLAESDFWHFLLKAYLGRMAVPLFLISSGYFFRQKQKENMGYARAYFSKQCRTYLFWSAIYLPYGVWFLQGLSLPAAFYPFAVPVGLGYLGFCYHLWYFPALFFGLILVNRLKRHYSWLFCFGICFLLYTIGSIETYSGFLTDGWLKTMYETYQRLFFTTRNGLFYTPVFLLIGFFIADHPKHRFLHKFLLTKLIISLGLLALELFLVCQKEGDDKNFLFMLLPVSLFLLSWLLQSENFLSVNLAHLRPLGQLMFFLHPLFLEGSKTLLYKCGIVSFQGLPLFFLTLAATHFTAKMIIHLKKTAASPFLLLRKELK
ncbi:membrane protein [Enterococcus florum]|uniref:Membrane protein n=1 Tax=Enterococcus florum TaxID=2480627 RepID=A0A4P5PGX5_9ENTE|nr:acyltransferase family protein [Enterococcus florum]GCF95568.1 membrane protein [Enterococcus florum]